MRKQILLCGVLAACSTPDNAAGPDAPVAGMDDADVPGDGPKSPPGPRLIPGPQQPGFDLALATKAAAYDRQFHTFNAQPFGLSLDAMIPDAADRALVAGFLAQHATDDFATFAG